MTMNFSGRIRHLDFLTHEEKVALWALRTLAGPQKQKGFLSLVRLLGEEAASLQRCFQGFFLHTVHGTNSLELSSTEQHLLHIMADMQNKTPAEGVLSELRNSLMQLSMTLAAYGYWLPCASEAVTVMSNLPDPTALQDNVPLLMQAAE